MNENDKFKIIHMDTIDTEEWIRRIVRHEFIKLKNEFKESVDETLKLNQQRWEKEAMSTEERDAMWERHAHLVEAYMDNMNKILEKRL